MTFTVLSVPAMGAEDVVVADDGTVYTGTEDGTTPAPSTCCATGWTGGR